MGSVVKIDIISKIQNHHPRYIEITNYFMIIQYDKYGNKMLFTEELEDYRQSILGDVYKYYEDNALKSVKRLWMYLALKEKICDLSMFVELFSSDISLYSQIASDIEVALTLLSSDMKYDFNYLMRTLFDRLKQLNGLCITDNIIEKLESNNKKNIYSGFEELHKCIKYEVNRMTHEWLNERNINIYELIDNESM